MASLLVVDANDITRGTLMARLELLGHRVRGAVDATQARADLAQRAVDLVLLDVLLPGDGASRLLAERQQDPQLQRIPFAIIAGPHDMHALSDCIELGANDYLSKPFDPVLVQLRIESCLQSSSKHPQGVESRLSRFLSPAIAKVIAADESLLESHRREITVAFCDLRGFTAFSDTAEPEDIMAVLHEFHAAMGELIFHYEGTLEHFAGDGIMVFFNDPVPLADPAGQAVRMAVAMQQRAVELAAGWRDRGHELSMGMGIATGYATLGRIGFEGRFDYGAIGSVTNLAARLCAEAEAGQILVQRRVYAAVEQLVDAEPVGQLTLKGFARPVETLNVVGLRGAK